MPQIAKILSSHVGTSSNSKNYAPVFVNQDNMNPAIGEVGGIGYYTPNYIGIHNPSTSGVFAQVWTVFQGTSGTGANIYLPAGSTFYTNICQINVASGVTLTVLGIPYSPNYQ